MSSSSDNSREINESSTPEVDSNSREEDVGVVVDSVECEDERTREGRVRDEPLSLPVGHSHMDYDRVGCIYAYN